MRSGVTCRAQRDPEVGRGQAAAADPSAAGGLKRGVPMRLLIAVILVMVVPMTLREMTVPAAASESAERTIALYDPNPAHIWNRLYATLLVRKNRRGASYGQLARSASLL